MKYDLKDPFDITESKRCEAIEFRQPRGKESQKVFNLLGALSPIAEGKIPLDLADTTLKFISDFGEVVGHSDFPISEVCEAVSSRDILEIAQQAVDHFT